MIYISEADEEKKRCTNTTLRNSLCGKEASKKILICKYYGVGPNEFSVGYDLRKVCEECASLLERNEDDVADHADSFVEVEGLNHTFPEEEPFEETG